MSMRKAVARVRRFACISLAINAVLVVPAGTAEAQRGTDDQRAAGLVGGLTLSAPMRQALQAAVLEALHTDDCDDTEFNVRLVDLNGDTIPEVHLTANGPCVDSRAGGTNWVFVRDRTGEWRENLAFNGGLLPLASRSHGYVDIVVAGPGFTTPVWRWDGAEYSLYCFAAEGPDAGRQTCPSTLIVREAAEDLAPFTRRPPRVLGQPQGAGSSPARANQSTLVGDWRIQETMEGNVAGWPTRCTAAGTLRVRLEAGELMATHRTERLECRNPDGSFRQGPWENRFAVSLSDSQVSFSPVEGCPYTATLSGAEMRGTLECTIGDEADEPMRVYGEWVATRVSSAR